MLALSCCALTALHLPLVPRLIFKCLGAETGQDAWAIFAALQAVASTNWQRLVAFRSVAPDVLSHHAVPDNHHGCASLVTVILGRGESSVDSGRLCRKAETYVALIGTDGHSCSVSPSLLPPMMGWMDARTHPPTCRPQGCGIENAVSKERGHVLRVPSVSIPNFSPPLADCV
jgi:hypothetical protein